MKTYKIIVLFIITTSLSLGYTSCNSHDYSNEINRVDSLLVVAEQLHQQVLKIDSASVMEKAEIVNADFKFVQDSLPEELFLKSSTFLNQIKTIKKMINSFPGEYRILTKETQYSVDQLNNLKIDLKNGSIKPDNVQKYIKDEAKALEVLNKHFLKINKALIILK